MREEGREEGKGGNRRIVGVHVRLLKAVSMCSAGRLEPL
jgi:hypothetical protein